MSKPKKIPAKALNAAAQAFADGTATRRTLQAVGIPQRQYPAIKDEADNTLRAFKQALSRALESTIMDMSERLHGESGKLSVGQIPVALGILIDKHKAVNEGHAPTHQALHIHLTSNDRDGMLKQLLGRANDRVNPSS